MSIVFFINVLNSVVNEQQIEWLFVCTFFFRCTYICCCIYSNLYIQALVIGPIKWEWLGVNFRLLWPFIELFNSRYTAPDRYMFYHIYPMLYTCFMLINCTTLPTPACPHASLGGAWIWLLACFSIPFLHNICPRKRNDTLNIMFTQAVIKWIIYWINVVRKRTRVGGRLCQPNSSLHWLELI